MRKLRLYPTLSLALMLMLIATGCDKYLSENPDNRVELNSPEKAAQLLTNAYSSASYSFTEWMGDKVDYIRSTTKFQNHNQAYNWEDFTGDAQDTPLNFWSSTYDAIAHSNEVLAIIDDLPGDEALKDAVKAEALLTRAYGHFMLVNLFALHYDKKTASKDLGIPYVSEPETVFIKKYTRNTVKEVYDKVEDDMLAGLKLVSDGYFANSGKYHFTKNAALAFASRFYLYKADYTNCIKYSSEMLGSDPNVFIKDMPHIRATYIDGNDFIKLYTAPGDASNLLLLRQVTNFHIPNYGYWPTDESYNEIFGTGPFSGDLRQEPAWQAGQKTGENKGGEAACRFEFLFERSSINSNIGLNYTIALGFKGEEVLLNRAECNIVQNNLTDALSDLQILASKRYSGTHTLSLAILRNAYQTSDSQDAMFSYLLDERIKEFIHEGLRWFDIKRFDIQVTHILEDNSKTITLKANDKRKVIQIPQVAIDVAGLEPNPR